MNLNLEEYDKSEVQLTTLIYVLNQIYDDKLVDGTLIIKDEIVYRFDNKRKKFAYFNPTYSFETSNELKIDTAELSTDILLIEPNEVEAI